MQQRAIGIAGAGRLGQAIGRILRDSGDPVVAIASRSLARARTAAAFIGAGVEAAQYEQLSVDRLLIAVPDDAIEGVAARIVPRPVVALHTSGARGVDALSALRERGTECGVLHPLQTAASAEAGVMALRGVAFAVSGDAAAVAWAKEIVSRMDGRVLEIDDRSRPLYHAAAVMASNYVVALIGAAESLLNTAGAPREDALNALAPLVRTSVENAFNLGPVAALTGPIQRGDVKTVAAHLEALAPLSKPVQLLYRAAALVTLELARRRGLANDRAAAIESMLG